MLFSTQSPTTRSSRRGPGRVRTSHLADLAQLEQLFSRTEVALVALDILHLLGTGLLVLDVDGEIIAAAFAAKADGHLERVVVDPTFRGSGVEERMLAVAAALAEARAGTA